MCEDLIFVTCHCPNESQVLRLNECIDRLLKVKDYHIAIITHTHVPIEIQKKVNYYIYDHLNELDDSDNLRHVESHILPVKPGEHKTLSNSKLKLQTKYFKKTPFYGFAIYRMFSTISNLAKNFSYKRLYHVEYDFLIEDLSIFTNHRKILETYDSVFYNSSETSEMILGGLKSFNVDKLPKLFKEYNKEEMKEKILSESLLPLEIFTETIFNEAGRIFKIPYIIIKDKVKSTKFIEQELNWCFYFNRETDYLGFCYLNYFKDSTFKITINKESDIDFEIKSNKNVYVELTKIDRVRHISVIRDGKVLYESEISDEYKLKLRENSYVEIV